MDPTPRRAPDNSGGSSAHSSSPGFDNGSGTVDKSIIGTYGADFSTNGSTSTHSSNSSNGLDRPYTEY